MSFPINDLPKEVLHQVFSYLSVHDKLNSSLVCKRWLQVINCKSLLRSIKVFIKDNNMPIFINMSRNFLNFDFRFVTIDNRYYTLFKRFSPVVEWLSFECCEMCNKDPIKFDLPYENLKVLKITHCDLWSLFPCLPNLTELYLKGKSIILDDGVAILQKTMKHLKALTLDINVAVDPKAYNRFYCYGDSYETNPSSLILSLPAIKCFISERVTTLKELNLHFAITSKTLEELSSIKGLCLTKICLSKCYECVSSLTDLFKNQRNLKVVDLHGLSNLNEDIIYALCNLLPFVEEVSVPNCNFTEMSLSKIFQLKNLKKLDIGRNYPLHSRILCKVESTNLQSLSMARILVENIDDLIKQFKYLQYLDLSYCGISDTVVHIISENLIHLEYLSLKGTDITDYGLNGPETTQHSNEEHSKSLSNLKHLKTLKLNECKKITDLGILKAVHFQYLRHLDIDGCHINIDTFEKLLLQNPNLKKLHCDH